MDPYIAAYRLFCTEGVGCASVAKTLATVGSLDALLGGSEAILDDAARAVLYALAKPAPDERKLLADWRERYTLYSVFADGYPERLRKLPDPPLLWFVQGSPIARWPQPTIVLVGSRRATPYGNGVTRAFAQDLATRGVAVGSGLAYGIDASAHLGALDGGGFTFAAVGHGVARIYPRDHERLAQEILDRGGAIVSEYPPTYDVQVFYFPARNRILAALADAVVVVEGAHKSGALITADVALDLGVPVLAVPGRIGDQQAEAPLSLLKVGAAPALCAESILEAAGWALAAKVAAPVHVPAPQRPLYDKIPVVGAVHIDDLAQAVGEPVPHLLNTLLQLELAGHITALPGKFFSRAGR